MHKYKNTKPQVGNSGGYVTMRSSTDEDKRARPSNPLGGGRHPQPATTTKITIEEMQKVLTTNTKNIYIKYNNKNRPANIKKTKV